MLKISTLLTSVDSFVINNTMNARMNDICYKVEFNERLPNGVVFFHNRRRTVALSSVTEYLKKCITPVDESMLVEIKENLECVAEIHIRQMNEYIKKKMIIHLDKYATIHNGCLWLFHKSGLLKINVIEHKEMNAKISSSLLTVFDGILLTIIEDDEYIGTIDYRSQVEIKSFHKKTSEKSLTAKEILKKVNTEYVDMDVTTTVGNKNMNVAVSKTGVMKVYDEYNEFYTVPIL